MDTMNRLLLPLLMASLLAACAAPAPSSSPASAPVSSSVSAPASIITVNYVCDGGSTLRVRFDNAAGMAYVSQPDGVELRLPQQRAASGIWYATPQHELRGKGDAATWTVGRRMPMQCKAQQP